MKKILVIQNVLTKEYYLNYYSDFKWTKYIMEAEHFNNTFDLEKILFFDYNEEFEEYEKDNYREIFKGEFEIKTYYINNENNS